jgi:hypothetical protein
MTGTVCFLTIAFALPLSARKLPPLPAELVITVAVAR